VQLVGGHVDSSVNNPIEAVAQWRAGKLRPLCVFDDTRMPYKDKVTDTQSWGDIPTCKEAGVPTDYVAAVKAGDNGKFKMAGTGSKQEDQIITVAVEKTVGKKFTYVPFKGGGDVAVQLVGKHVDSTVNNPIEAIAHWRSGALRPLCVFDSKPMPYPTKVTTTMSWQDIPTCKSAGLDVEYTMLRGIFMPAGVTQEQVDFYVDLFKRVRELPEWKKYTEDAAFNTTTMSGKEYADWVGKAESRHKDLMQEAGFLAK